MCTAVQTGAALLLRVRRVCSPSENLYVFARHKSEGAYRASNEWRVHRREPRALARRKKLLAKNSTTKDKTRSPSILTSTPIVYVDVRYCASSPFSSAFWPSMRYRRAPCRPSRPLQREILTTILVCTLWIPSQRSRCSNHRPKLRSTPSRRCADIEARRPSNPKWTEYVLLY